MLTVLMATHNGESTLPHVLSAYRHLEPPEGGWQLVIVDSASTDRTRALALSFADRLPLIYLYEPRRGQNRARNVGLSALKGDLLVLTDDDAIPHPRWLVELRAAADLHREFTIFGGAVLPRWPQAPEPWLLEWVPLGPAFAITDPSLQDGPVSPSLVYSPNMALRAEVIHAGYRFDERIGPDGTSVYAMGSETELTRRLVARGFSAWHCRAAIVVHIIRPHQMTERWLRGRAFRYGRGRFRAKVQARRAEGHGVLDTRLYVRLFAVLGWRSVRFAIAQSKRLPEDVFRRTWALCYSLGETVEGLASLRRPPPRSPEPDPRLPPR